MSARCSMGRPAPARRCWRRRIANECGVNFISVDGPEIFTKWLGESEEGVRQIFRIARQVAPTVIFFDQLDAIAPVRGQHAGSMTTDRVVSQLLAELDGVEQLSRVIVLGATNRIDLIDPSILRPGPLRRAYRGRAAGRRGAPADLEIACAARAARARSSRSSRRSSRAPRAFRARSCASSATRPSASRSSAPASPRPRRRPSTTCCRRCGKGTRDAVTRRACKCRSASPDSGASSLVSSRPLIPASGRFAGRGIGSWRCRPKFTCFQSQRRDDAASTPPRHAAQIIDTSSISGPVAGRLMSQPSRGRFHGSTRLPVVRHDRSRRGDGSQALHNQALAQNNVPADAGMQQPAPSTAPYEGSKANQKHQDHQPARARARSAEDPSGRRLRLHLERLRRQLDAAREHGRVRARSYRPAAARRHREGRPDGRDPRLQAVHAGHRPADGQPRPRARLEGGRHRQGRARGRHADADVDAVEPQHGGDRGRQSRAEVVPALRP